MTCGKEFADRLVANGGREGQAAPDNPRANRIVEYTNKWGGVCYGITFEGFDDPEKYLKQTEFIRNPKIYWEPGICVECGSPIPCPGFHPASIPNEG